MSWENVSGTFKQYKGEGISVTEVSIYGMPENPEEHSDHDDSYYYVGDKSIYDVDKLLEAVGLTPSMYAETKVVICTPRSSTLTIVDGQAQIEPDFFGSSEDVYYFDKEGNIFDWELNDEDEWERVYDR